MRDGAPAAARVEGRDEGAARHHHARRRQGKDLRRQAQGVLATPAQVMKPATSPFKRLWEKLKARGPGGL